MILLTSALLNFFIFKIIWKDIMIRNWTYIILFHKSHQNLCGVHDSAWIQRCRKGRSGGRGGWTRHWISYIIGGVNGKTVGFQENDVALRGRWWGLLMSLLEGGDGVTGVTLRGRWWGLLTSLLVGVGWGLLVKVCEDVIIDDGDIVSEFQRQWTYYQI